MNDLSIPTKGQKICSDCLRKLPVRFYLVDHSRSDGLACNCIHCLFPNSKYWKAKCPELWEPNVFPKVAIEEIPALLGRHKGGMHTGHNLKAMRVAVKEAIPNADNEKNDVS
jgi:hypothetical protein